MKNIHSYREPRLLLTTGEVADRLGVREATIRNWAKRGTLPSVLLGARTLRFDPDAIAAFIEARRNGEVRLGD